MSDQVIRTVADLDALPDGTTIQSRRGRFAGRLFVKLDRITVGDEYPDPRTGRRGFHALAFFKDPLPADVIASKEAADV